MPGVQTACTPNVIEEGFLNSTHQNVARRTAPDDRRRKIVTITRRYSRASTFSSSPLTTELAIPRQAPRK
ncbi:hypothetical protein Acor_30510 [Acrocarpospora corrugata]|uniref:Uncharacterized protein n=1 Tax=Acrocarpospora corrugata TaxID=35763 RepID=A0A5M3VVY7_9ACTN|nr:hypothetical protein Acor_30510 [Acrocarpospora corrugata]